MNEKRTMKQSIDALCFSILETELYLDTHPRDAKALQMLREYRRRKREAIAAYEAKFGRYIVTKSDVPATDRWSWIDSPWPWERQV
ncbi:MAG: spore coat protein CotJB [Clostridia bacterium]|nr:spore coat protein CotJB [Clostridia bacterium]